MKVQDSGEVLLQEVDESVGGRVVGADVGVVLQLRLDLLRQLLPQFDAVGGDTATRYSCGPQLLNLNLDRKSHLSFMLSSFSVW